MYEVYSCPCRAPRIIFGVEGVYLWVEYFDSMLFLKLL